MTNRNPRWAIVAGFSTVAIIGVATFVLAFRTFPGRISAPFNLLPRGSTGALSFNLQEQDNLSDLLISTKDTDGDGITDAQELKIYNTSPFLEDSDSDGLGDKAEIDAGQDPNCPQGTDCRAAALPSARETEQQELVEQLYETSVISKIADSGIPGLTDAQTIRTNLSAAGVPGEVLDQFTDEELTRLFNQATVSPAGAYAPPGGEEINLSEVPAPSAIRELLLGAGAKSEVIDSFSDEELVKLYRETLAGLKRK